MNRKQVMKLKPGDSVTHTRYGESVVREVVLSGNALFGVEIIPATGEGSDLLRRDAGTYNCVPLLESSIRRLKAVTKATA